MAVLNMPPRLEDSSAPGKPGFVRRLLAAWRNRNHAAVKGFPMMLRHKYAITHLGQADGWIRPHRYRYLCVRCRWTFLIDNRRGDPIAIGPDDLPIIGEEGRLRMASFSSGPCPGQPGRSAVALQIARHKKLRRLPLRVAVQSEATAGRQNTR